MLCEVRGRRRRLRLVLSHNTMCTGKVLWRGRVVESGSCGRWM